MIEARFKKKIITGDGVTILDINLSLPQAEFVALFGPSGCGKTTLLKILAGLTQAEEGFISVDGDIWFDSKAKINLLPQKRNVGFVFQEYNLFPNMTLRENIQFALDPLHDEKLIDEYLKLAGLAQVQDFYPRMLSGGQKQRAALIRALIRKPKILLLDEPFSALDIPTRLLLQEEVLKIHAQFKIPTILVTHDVTDVLRLSKRILVLQEGKIRQENHGFFLKV